MLKSYTKILTGFNNIDLQGVSSSGHQVGARPDDLVAYILLIRLTSISVPKDVSSGQIAPCESQGAICNLGEPRLVNSIM